MAKKISGTVKWFDSDPLVTNPKAQATRKWQQKQEHKRPQETCHPWVASHAQQHQKILGSVKWLDADRGYGFIVADTNEEIFVHRKDMEKVGKPLQAGDRVEFNVKAGGRGTKAGYVTPILGERGGPNKEFPLEELQVDKEEEEKESNVKKQQGRSTPDPQQLKEQEALEAKFKMLLKGENQLVDKTKKTKK